MRRRGFWILGAAILATLISLLIFTNRNAPFVFLEGHDPLKGRVNDAFRHVYGVASHDPAVYSFPARDVDIDRRIKPELLAMGFQEVSVGSASITYSRGPRNNPESVTIYPNTRVPAQGNYLIMVEQGWVIVVVQLAKDNSPWRRLRNWIGL